MFLLCIPSFPASGAAPASVLLDSGRKERLTFQQHEGTPQQLEGEKAKR